MAQKREKGDTKTRYCSKRERGLNGLKYTKLFWHSAMPKKFGIALCQKNLAFDGFSHPVAERILGLYAKCTLHLAFDRPIADALI